VYCTAKLDVDDVFVVGQHQRLGALLVAHVVAVADFGRAHLRDVDGFVGLDRCRPAPVEAGAGGVGKAAEGGDHADLTFLHDEGAAGEPDQQGDEADDGSGDAGAAAFAAIRAAGVAAVVAAAAEQAVQAGIEIAPHLIEVGWTLTRTAPFLGFMVALGIFAPAWIVQRKFNAETFK
jgi:hypothetical protein